jgi:hypothetical protein
MRRIRFSIAGLLGLVAFSGAGFAALRAASEPWDSGLFGVTLLLLLAAILLAVHRTWRTRAFWLGFALYGWAYLVGSLIPQIESRLPTTRALAYLDAKVRRQTGLGITYADLDADGQLDVLIANASTPAVLQSTSRPGQFLDVTAASSSNGSGAGSTALVLDPSRSWKLLAASGGTSEHFVRIGHTIAALILAFLGGCFSRHLGSRTQESTTA